MGESKFPESLYHPRFRVGQKVRKVTGDYAFVGHVVAVFMKRNPSHVRYVVENADGILHIYSAKNLEAVSDE